jgi:hypothetical protein
LQAGTYTLPLLAEETSETLSTAANALIMAQNHFVAPTGQNLAQVLNNYDRTKRSTDIPLFYRQPNQDTIAARLLITRINDAATIAGWDQARKILEFKMCLRNRVVSWFELLQEDGLDLDNWDVVKAEFMETYEPKYSTRTTCANFTNLTHKSKETINDYHYRVQMAYKWLTDNKPATMAAVWLAGATVTQAKAGGITDTFTFVKHQLFLAGLKDNLDDKVLEAHNDTNSQRVKLAWDLEAIQNNHKRSQKIVAIKAELQLEEANTIVWEELTEHEIEQIAAIHAHNNCSPPKKFANGPAHNTGQPRNSSAWNLNIVCRSCHKKGHLQKECFSRQRDNGPMVDANGKRYEDAHVGSVANLSPYHNLNW